MRSAGRVEESPVSLPKNPLVDKLFLAPTGCRGHIAGDAGHGFFLVAHHGCRSGHPDASLLVTLSEIHQPGAPWFLFATKAAYEEAAERWDAMAEEAEARRKAASMEHLAAVLGIETEPKP